MKQLLLFLFGSIRFQAQGGFAERFLNLCRVKGVKLYELSEKGGTLFAATSLSSFRKLRRCASRSGMRVKITQKRGLPFIYARFAGRSGLFIGIALACFLLFFYSRSLWSIELTGNEHVSAERVKTVLAQNGVQEGTFKKNIDNDKISFALYEAIPELAWLNLRIDGSRLCVDVRESIEKPAETDQKHYANIIAAKGGVVDKVRVYEGESLIKEGDGVARGQLLVSGVVYHESSKKNTFHHSRAEIYAFTSSKKRIEVPKVYRKTVYTGRERQYRVLQLFRLKLPLYIFSKSFEKAEVTTVKKPLIICGKELPLVLYCYDVKQVREQRATASQKAAAVFARAQIRAVENAWGSDVKILSRKRRVEEKKDSFVFFYEYKLYENIARPAVFSIQQDESSS